MTADEAESARPSLLVPLLLLIAVAALGLACAQLFGRLARQLARAIVIRRRLALLSDMEAFAEAAFHAPAHERVRR